MPDVDITTLGAVIKVTVDAVADTNLMTDAERAAVGALGSLSKLGHGFIQKNAGAGTVQGVFSDPLAVYVTDNASGANFVPPADTTQPQGYCRFIFNTGGGDLRIRNRTNTTTFWTLKPWYGALVEWTIDGQALAGARSWPMDEAGVGGGGGGGSIVLQDEGSAVAGAPHSTLDFVGAGVTVSNAGNGKATVSIPGGGGSTGGTTIVVKDENTNVGGTPHSALNFVGAGVTVTDGGSGQANISIPGGGAGGSVSIQDEGNAVTGTPHSILNFTGTSVAATDAGGGKVNISISAAAGGNFSGFAFASSYLSAGSSADQHAALNTFFDQARNNGKHLIFDQGPTTYFTSRTHMFGRSDWEGPARAAIHNKIIDFGGATIKAHSAKDYGTQFERRAVLYFRNCTWITLQNGKIDGGRDLTPQATVNLTSGNPLNEFKPAVYCEFNCDDWYLNNMWMGNSWGDGIELEWDYANINVAPKRWRVSDCVFDKGGRNSFTVNYGQSITFTNCVFSNAGGSERGKTLFEPMAGLDSEPYRDNVVGVRGIIFVGCRFEYNCGDGLEIFSNDTGPDNITRSYEFVVQGCIFRNNGRTQHGKAHIHHRGTRIIITGCLFTGTTYTPPENDAYGINLLNYSRDLWGETIISDCIFIDNPGFARIINVGSANSTPAQATPLLISNCIIDGSNMNGAGPLIYLNNGDRISVKNVILKGKGSGSTTYGIQITGGVANCVIAGVEASNLGTAVQNGGSNTRRIDQVTRVSDVNAARGGTAAPSEVGNV